MLINTITKGKATYPLYINVFIYTGYVVICLVGNNYQHILYTHSDWKKHHIHLLSRTNMNINNIANECLLRPHRCQSGSSNNLPAAYTVEDTHTPQHDTTIVRTLKGDNVNTNRIRIELSIFAALLSSWTTEFKSFLCLITL